MGEWQGERTRPTSWEEYQERSQIGMATDEGRAVGLNFQPRPTDVIITPFGKSGTTWMQQIVHGLRTRGDMDFDDISRVVPWLEMSTDLGVDIHGPQRGDFRAFKSHLSWDEVPKGGRYIVSIREPKDVAVSMFRFTEGWFFEVGSVSIEKYVSAYLERRKEGAGGYWGHLRSWWPQIDNENVLLLAYEDMKADLPWTVRLVADFIGIDLDDDLFEIVVRQSSLPFMLKHKDRFDDKLIRERSERMQGLPKGSDSAKVRKGQVGSHRAELPSALAEEMDQIWQEEIAEPLGIADYEELRRRLREHYRVPFPAA